MSAKPQMPPLRGINNATGGSSTLDPNAAPFEPSSSQTQLVYEQAFTYMLRYVRYCILLRYCRLLYQLRMYSGARWQMASSRPII